jgi:hypothetical protein
MLGLVLGGQTQVEIDVITRHVLVESTGNGTVGDKLFADC